MQEVLHYLNCRIIGNTRNIYPSRTNQVSAYIPISDTVIPRLACQETNIYESCGKAGPVPPFASKCRKDNILDLLAVANDGGRVMLIDTRKDNRDVHTFIEHPNAIYDICWLPDKNHLITVSSDHRAYVWDLNTQKNINSFEGHTGSIKSVDACPNNSSMFATGSEDGTICVWDMRYKNCHSSGNIGDKPSIHIKSVHCRKIPKTNVTLNSSVTAVAFQDNINLASTGSTDSVVKIWDMRKNYISMPFDLPSPCYQMKYKDDKEHCYGYTSLAFDSFYKKLYASSISNKILMFDCYTYSNAEIFYDGFKCKSFYIKLALSVDDQYLACGSSSNKAYVWKTNKPGHPKWEFPGHTSEVSTVAWASYDNMKFVTCGADNNILIWKMLNIDNTEQLNRTLFKASKYRIGNLCNI